PEESPMMTIAPSMKPLHRNLVAVAAVALLAHVTAPTAVAEAVSCKRTIARAGAQFGRAKLHALQKGRDAVLNGKSPGTCPDGKASQAISKATAKLKAAIAKRCGGGDGDCTTTGDNDSLASIGWNLGSCQNFESGSCTNALNNCADVATCVLCINEAA